MNTISNQIEFILTKQQLEKDYIDLKSLTKIAKKYGISDVPIRTRFIKYGIPFKSKNHINKCNHNIFGEDSERSFYLAGFLAADGCIRISKTNKNSEYVNHRVVICLSKKDEKFLEMIRDLLESNHEFNYYVNKLSKYSDKWNDSECVKISITSKQMVEDLKRFNVVPRKSLIYVLPEWLKTHPLKHHFIRGYNDGDGSFYFCTDIKNKNITWSLRGTIDLLKACKNIIENECKFTTRAEPKIQNGIGNIKIHSNILVSKLVDFLYKDATIYLSRKYEIAKLAKEKL